MKRGIVSLATVSLVILPLVSSQIPNPGHDWPNIICDAVFCIDPVSGRVSIGDTTPDSLFHVRNPGAAVVAIDSGSGGSQQYSAVDFWHDGAPVWGVGKDDGAGDFYVDQSILGNVLTITRASGDVGIGTTSPLSPLEIARNVDFSIALRHGAQPVDAKVWHISNKGGLLIRPVNDAEDTVLSDPLTLLRNGNVGIGTTSPETTLDVNGPIRMGQFASKPACTASILGSIVFDTANDRPYVCASASTWKPLDSDFDEDGLMETLDPDDTTFNPTCTADNGGQCFITQATKTALDPDLTAANIESGVNIFGVTGTGGGGDLIERYSFDTGATVHDDGSGRLVEMDWGCVTIGDCTNPIPTFSIPASAKRWQCSATVSSQSFWGNAPTWLDCDGTWVMYIDAWPYDSYPYQRFDKTGIRTDNPALCQWYGSGPRRTLSTVCYYVT